MVKKRNGQDLPLTRKYELYEQTVQNVEADIDFIESEYKKLKSRDARTLREDFGGTGALACKWVARHPENLAWAVDLDPEPIQYGLKRHYALLDDEQQKRMKYIEANVLDDMEFKTDIVIAFNFSYFIFKKRNQLLSYFKKVREGLNDDGVFFIDLFGGTECRQELEEETEFDNHTYYWDCDKYNAITDEATYYIHFKDNRTDEKFEKVFHYDWRMWSMAELQDILWDAGFSEVLTYWEEDEEDDDDDDDSTTGSGLFYQSREEDNCESWVTYIVAKK